MKYALLIGNNEYDDQKLAQLKTPEADVRALEEVLEAKTIGNFDVTVLLNEKESISRRFISAFLSDKKPDDLVLLYFSGHGVLDGRGSLFLALKDTQSGSLNATAISSSFITYEMDNCRSKQQILILDCCNSGAFARGTKGEQKAVTESTFEGSGSGRVVLTASDSTQFAFEGDQVIKQSELSLFTHFLLEGLKTGEADRNNDGRVSLDEWYDYSYSKVIASTPRQIPHKWSYNQQGDLVIAQNPFVKVGSAEIVSIRRRTMLDQKQLEYRQHKLLLSSKELEIIAEEIKNTNADLTDAEQQLLLFSALAYGNALPWLDMSGGKALEWLRQACFDESFPLEVRSGAAAHLGRNEDQQALNLLLDCSQQEPDRTKRNTYLDLLTSYLNSSRQQHRLPWIMRRKLFLRLIQLPIKESVAERARMSRISAYIAPLCVLITYASIMLVPTPTISWPTAFFGAVFNIIIGVIFAITFAQLMTALVSMTYSWSFLGKGIVLAAVGSSLGAALFLALAGYIHVWFAGGLIGLALAITQPGANKKMAFSFASFFAILSFTGALLILDAKTSANNLAGYAFSVGLFVAVYVFQHIRGQRLLE